MFLFKCTLELENLAFHYDKSWTKELDFEAVQLCTGQRYFTSVLSATCCYYTYRHQSQDNMLNQLK